MSVLFPKVNKMPTWNWRPIYYDPQKEEMERKLKMLQEKRAAEENAANEQSTTGSKKPSNLSYTPSLHKGSFRESHEEHMSIRQKANRQSKLVLWIVILCLLVFTFYVLL